MNIAYITIYPPKWELHCKKSGVAPYTKNLISNTNYSDEDEVYVICDKDNWTLEKYIENGVKVSRVFDRNLNFYKNIIKEIDLIKPDKVHIQQELSLYWNILTAILLTQLVKLIKKRSIEVIITFHWIVDLNNIDKEFIKENFSSLPPFLVKKAFEFIFKPLIKNSDKIIVHEELFKNRIVNQYSWDVKKINVIHHWIEKFEIISKEDSRKKINLDLNKNILLFMWYITWYKWIDLLIEWFWEYIKKFDKEAVLYILWPHHPKLKNDELYLKEFNRLKDKAFLNLGKNYIWDDEFVNWEKMSIYYPASDLVLFPYTRSLSSSWPMAISIWYEIPFLASDVFKEIIEDDSFLFEKDKNSMAEKIDFFFKNKDKYTDLIKNIRKERLWENIWKITYNFYKI